MMMNVKKLMVTLLAVLPFSAHAQSYDKLWKQVEEAFDKDLPLTQKEGLEKIESLALQKKDYGQLLAARASKLDLVARVTPDSLDVELQRMEAEAIQLENSQPVLAAITYAVIGKTLLVNEFQYDLDSKREKHSDAYFAKALARPDLLAAQTTSAYQPFVSEAVDSRIFGHDLLHVIGMETERYDLLASYYEQAGNRAAACLCHARLQGQRQADATETLATVDSLIAVYGDLPECGELAKLRYELMRRNNGVTPRDKAAYIDDALNRWKQWPYMDDLVVARQYLTEPNVVMEMGQEVERPGVPRTIHLNEIRNLSSVTLTVSRLDVTGDTDLDVDLYDDGHNYKHLLSKDWPPRKLTHHFRDVPEYELQNDSVVLDGLPAGVYLVELSANKPSTDFHRRLYFVSDLYLLSEQQPDNSIRYAVVNATTGQPVPGASIHINVRNNASRSTSTQVLKTNERGEALFPLNHQSYIIDVFATTDQDRYLPKKSSGDNYRYYQNLSVMRRMSAYSDRRLYRPGQTVHVTAVAWTEQMLESHVVDEGTTTFELRDANYHVVATQKVSNDRFGTAQTDFTLPQSGLTGQYRVTVRHSNGSQTAIFFNVEEYKRPTFQVEFPEYKESYAAGDTVPAKGHAKTYSGVPVQGACVKYSVIRRQALWWWYRGTGPAEEVLAEGETTTDDSGAFTVNIPMTLPQEARQQATANDWKTARFYHFVVNATVTDLAGESHEGSISLPLGNRTTAFSSDLPDKTVADSLQQVTFSRLNAAGQPIPGDVNVWIDGHPINNGKTVPANQPVKLAPLASGAHEVKAICGSDTLVQQLVVFSMTDSHPVVDTHDWFYVSADEFPRDGSPVYVQMGATDANQHIVYSIFAGKTVLESGVIDQSNAITTRTFVYEEAYETGITLTCAWVRDGQCYQHETHIRRPLPDKRLVLEWNTFRDRLTPGQQEEWALTVKTPDGQAADAQLMATLYDKSLDQLAAHNWSLTLGLVQNTPSAQWRCLRWRNLTAYYNVPFPSIKVKMLSLSHFDEKYFNFFYRPSRVPSYVKQKSYASLKSSKTRAVKAKAAKPAFSNIFGTVETAAAAPMEDAMNSIEMETADEDVASGNSNSTTNTGTGQVRENLNETAFFYPQLSTDANGAVTLRFTLPESITTWKFMGLAHDQEMRHGMITGEAIAQKTVMVQPNVPRFVREGDRAQLSARVFNTSDQRIKGKAVLELINPETGKVVSTLIQNYVLAAQETGSVSFTLPALSAFDTPLLIARTTVSSKGYSDGEQHYLPVLPDREMVTNTMPYTQHGPGVKTVNLDNLFPKGTTHQRLTVEYTSNPTWLMIQALPYMSHVTEDNAVSLVTAYYANRLGQEIMNLSPSIRWTLEQWQQEQGPETSLMSSLQKDQELKTMVLSETPWVMDAQNETEQRQALIRFFDQNTIAANLQTCLSGLAKLQNSDGSWSWWPGMRGNVYMTTMVSRLLARLKAQIDDRRGEQMRSRAMDYLAGKVHEEVVELQKLEKKGGHDLLPSVMAVEYLYSRVLGGESLTKRQQDDADYLVNLLAKQPQQFTIYGKAVTAVVLQGFGHQQTAREYVQSIREYTVSSEEMGRYFDTSKAYYSWFDYRIPTQTAAIEAMKCITPNDTAIEEMQRWLLMSKRTQAWDTPINSVDAVFAFSDHGNMKALGLSCIPAQMQLDGKTIELPRQTAALGYVKTTVDAPNAHRFTAEKQTDGTSWGAVYAQFQQAVTEIGDAQSGIAVKRELILPTGEVASGNKVTLKVGDKVTIRITIQADRDYDFVQVSDKRAACLEPTQQLSGYRNGYYCAPKDYTTNYYFDMLAKGKRVVETAYYVDRAGTYQTGTCTAQCAYAPEYTGRAQALILEVLDEK